MALTTQQQADLANWRASLSGPSAADVKAHAATLLASVAAAYSPEERETWPEQTLEALSYAQDNTVSVPLLTALADGRGITVSAMATTVLANRDAYKAAAAAILGRQAEVLAMNPIPANFREIW